MKDLSEVKVTEPVFACNLAAIDRDRREGHIQNTKQLFGMAKAITERPDGYAFEFELNTDTLLRAARFVDLERLCCPFFGFTLEIGPGAAAFRLALNGPQGVKPFIEAEFGLNPLESK